LRLVEEPCCGTELDGRGIGLARFGDDPETVIAAVSRAPGPPTADTGFIDPVELQVIGFCGGATQRSVSWGNFDPGLIDQEYRGYVGMIA
jgi:dUTPase